MGVSDMLYSREQQVHNVFMEAPHVVILGAGASIAAVPRDANGRSLPSMQQLATVEPIPQLLSDAGLGTGQDGFEAEYAKLRASGQHDEIADRIDTAVRNYFAGIVIPTSTTIYDHLLLALRPKDLVATFNWDPLIVQAQTRLRNAGVTELPQVVFLHGNVAVASCLEHRVEGLSGDLCPTCQTLMESVPLLYPVTEKRYEANPFIAQAWETLDWGLKRAVLVTVFGYSAPVSDRAALERFQQAWGTPDIRQFEQFELIGRPGSDPDCLRARWDDFIHTHHYRVFDDYFESRLARTPRRSAEVFNMQHIEGHFTDVNPVPRGLELEATIGFYRDLIELESPR